MVHFAENYAKTCAKNNAFFASLKTSETPSGRARNRTITERNPIEEKREEENKNTNNSIISIWGIEAVAMLD